MHYVTLLLTLWTTMGLVVDAWAHGQPGTVETFLSPWHGMFYSGFLATAAWILWPVVRSLRAGRHPLAAVPAGYGLGIAGVGVFAFGGLSDMLWHGAFGIERGIEALMSPPHLFLFIGLMLITSCPFRSLWAVEGDAAPSFGAFLPALLSLTLTTLVAGIAIIHLWGFASAHYMTIIALERFSREFMQTPRALGTVREITQQRGTGNILLTNVVLLAPVLLMLRRWRPPFGSITVFFTLTVGLMAAMTGFFYLALLLASVLGGLIADGLVEALQPSPQRVWAFRAFATVVPVVLWSLFFLAIHTLWSLAWSPTLWVGVILWTGISGLGVSLVAAPGGRVP